MQCLQCQHENAADAKLGAFCPPHDIEKQSLAGHLVGQLHETHHIVSGNTLEYPTGGYLLINLTAEVI